MMPELKPAKPFVPYDHMAKYTTLNQLHEAKRTRRHIITLWDVLRRAFELGAESKTEATRPDGGDSLREALEKLKHLLSLKSLAEVRTMVVPNSGHTIAFQNDDFEYEGYLLRADVREAVRILAALTSLAAKDGE